MKQQANIAIFVPHSGCPNQCSFCNQHSISGSAQPPTPEQVSKICETAIKETQGRFSKVEIAFFGGSFTAIKRDLMIELLQAAQPYIGEHGAYGIRISTRPDAIDKEVLDILRTYGVTAIELGAQSMDDRVLKLNRRGHTSADTVRSAQLIKEYGFSLGLQMMVGLLGDTPEGAMETGRKLAELKPDTVRIYPTVVLEHTPLAKLWAQGEYSPLTLDDGIEICAKLLSMFNENGINVIRLGLQAGDGLEASMLAGCYHPALRELVEGRIMYNDIIKLIEKNSTPKGAIDIFTSPNSVSKLTGHGKKWLSLLKQQGYTARVLPDDALRGLEVRI